MTDTTDPALLGAAQGGDPIALTRLLVSTPSVNPTLAPGGAGEEAMARLCARLLELWGLETSIHEVAPGRYNVVAILPGAGPTLLLNGHLDTVGVEGMTVPPFQGAVEGGRIVGRGACDMKGGVAALMSAAQRMAVMDERPNLVVALTADEEHASIGMDHLVRSGIQADLAVVCEPTSLKVMPAHKGFVWIEADFTGRAAHGSRPDEGVDAIRHAALYVAALDGLARELAARPSHPLLGHASLHAGTISGGTAESVYPHRCRVLLERRTLPGETGDAVLREFQAVLDGLSAIEGDLQATLAVTLERPGTEVGQDAPLVRGLRRASEAVGGSSELEGMTAWVDAAFLNEAGIPAVCYGPGSIAQAHSADEWVPLDEVRMCADALVHFGRGLR
jgi:acetylornithine deacetylase